MLRRFILLINLKNTVIMISFDGTKLCSKFVHLNSIPVIMTRSPHSHQLLGTRWVNTNSSVEIILRSPHFHCNCHTLNHFPSPIGCNMTSNDTLRFRLNNKFHERISF
mmetsp:Transcript_13552/g.28915  ORF Transcript_13552/g.28915 Transcript_13552/m.28915 type:complete len:108 (+) Transcript_13552:36-359(+)